jgi:hypothetical protein
MIVKNEVKTLERCAASLRSSTLKSFIHAWSIVDTGSTDGTQDLAKRLLSDFPGTLHERPWVSMGHNRSEAIKLAAGAGATEYLLMIDADDVIEADPGFEMPSLMHDAYEIDVVRGDFKWTWPHLFRADLDFRFEGVVHALLTSSQPRTRGRLEGIRFRCSPGRAYPERFREDARRLEEALASEPNDLRNLFYLAQSYRDAGESAKALAAYRARIDAAGPHTAVGEETWCCYLEIAKLLERAANLVGRGASAEGESLGASDERLQAGVVDAYLRAFEKRPSRAEPLAYLSMFLRRKGRTSAALPFAQLAADIALRGPPRSDKLLVDTSVYAWRAQDEFGVSAYRCGRYAEAGDACEVALANGPPEEHAARIRENLRLSRERQRT